MLSSEAPDLSPGRLHRQNSTPTTQHSSNGTIDSAGPSSLGFHRRGLSLDQTITPRNAKILTNQESNKITIEEVFRQHPNHQAMQETQHKHIMARPGQQHLYQNTGTHQQQHEIPIAPRPERGFSDEQLNNVMNDWNIADFHSFNATGNFNELDVHHLLNSTTTSAGYLDGFGSDLDDISFRGQLNEAIDQLQMQRRVPFGPVLVGPTYSPLSQRPQTPENQTGKSKLDSSDVKKGEYTDRPSGHFPMTPAATPYSSKGVARRAHTRTADSSPTRRDPQLTIKATHAMQRGGSYQDNFATMSKHPLSPGPSPPHTAPLKPRGSIDRADFPAADFFNMSKLQMDVPIDKGGYEGLDYSPLSKATSSAMSSFQSSPEVNNMSLFEDFAIGMNGAALSSRLSNLTATQSNDNLSGYSSPEKGSLHSRSQSTSEIEDLEECIEDTGITGDEIASFISGPDMDNKWTCLYTGCLKKFGRKENIKSHVQTHLGDRQYRCKQCGKCFVRQHDLKRHANIHTNARLYTCPCGKDFARHDALTRHRQRGMCTGAFANAPKKIMKRGRPKKKRPDSNDGIERAAKTRGMVLERLVNESIYASSSASSVSSHPSPPELIEDASMGASSPSNGRVLAPQVSNTGLRVWTPPQSPGFSASHTVSAQSSQHSHYTQAPSNVASPMMIPELPMSRQGSGESFQSHDSGVPELDLSSSSPAASKVVEFSSSDAGTASPFNPYPPKSPFSSDFFQRDFALSDGLANIDPTPPDSALGAFFNFNDFEDKPAESTPQDEGVKANDPLMPNTPYPNDSELDMDTLFRDY